MHDDLMEHYMKHYMIVHNKLLILDGNAWELKPFIELSKNILLCRYKLIKMRLQYNRNIVFLSKKKSTEVFLFLFLFWIVW